MTLAKARVEAKAFFDEARRGVRSGARSSRRTSEELIRIFWGILDDLNKKDKAAFIAWFEKKHAALGKELGAK